MNVFQSYAVDEITQIYDKCMSEIDQHLQAISQVMPQGQHVQILHNLLEAVMVARNSREIVTALACLQKVRQYNLANPNPNPNHNPNPGNKRSTVQWASTKHIWKAFPYTILRSSVAKIKRNLEITVFQEIGIESKLLNKI